MTLMIKRVTLVTLVAGALAAAGCGKSDVWKLGHDAGYDIEREGYSEADLQHMCIVYAGGDGIGPLSDSEEYREYEDGCYQGWKDRHYST